MVNSFLTLHGVLHPFNNVSCRDEEYIWLRKDGVDEVIQGLPAVRISGEPTGVHKHREGRPVGKVMPEEVVEQEIVGGLLGAIVVASVDHGANGRRLLLVLVVNHRHFPKTRMRILGAGSNLALLGRLVIERVWPNWRVVLGSRQAGIVEHATTAHSFKHKITAWLQVRSAESFDILGPNLAENLQRLLHAANLLRPPVDVGLFESGRRFVSDGMIGDFVAFGVKLLREPVIVPLVSYVKCAADGTTVRVDAVGTEQILVKLMNIGIDAIVECKHDKLWNGFGGKIVGDFSSRAKAVW